MAGMQMTIEMAQEQAPDPKHETVYCVYDDKPRYLPVCEKRCHLDGRCVKFWAKLDLLGIDRKDLF